MLVVTPFRLPGRGRVPRRARVWTLLPGRGRMARRTPWQQRSDHAAASADRAAAAPALGGDDGVIAMLLAVAFLAGCKHPVPLHPGLGGLPAGAGQVAASYSPQILAVACSGSPRWCWSGTGAC